MEFLYEYGLFFAKTITFVIAIAVILTLIVSSAVKPKAKKGEIEIDDLSEQLTNIKEGFLNNTLGKKELKAYQKQQKIEQKKAEKEEPKSRLYVIDFNGSMDAHEVVISIRNSLFSIHALTLLSETTGMPNPIPSCNRTMILVICGAKCFERYASALVKDLIAVHI